METKQTKMKIAVRISTRIGIPVTETMEVEDSKKMFPLFASFIEEAVSTGLHWSIKSQMNEVLVEIEPIPGKPETPYTKTFNQLLGDFEKERKFRRRFTE